VNESLLREETLTTADIAHSERERRDIPVEAAAFNPALDSANVVADDRVLVVSTPTAEGPGPIYADSARSNVDATEQSRVQPQFAEQQPMHQSAQPGPLFPDDELRTFRSRWDQAQSSFVDEPKKAVEQADSLVANVVKRIAEQFSAERETLETQWEKGGEVSTEDLRQALKRYRSFFERLLIV
jgi:hypothetical protein